MKNLPALLYQFNWIDIGVVILALRICYSSFKKGLKFEFFKLLGIICGVYLSLHYYFSLSAFFSSRIFNRHTHSGVLDLLSFASLILAGYGAFALLRILIGKAVQSEINTRIDKWGGVALGVCRAALTVSIVLCLLILSSSEYVKKSIHSSFSGAQMVKIAPNTYVYLNGFLSKLQGNERLNPAVQNLTKIN
jgi:uncharacterized membrane protein required for colicin V production